MRVQLTYHTCDLCRNDLVELVVYNDDNARVFNLHLPPDQVRGLRDDCSLMLEEVAAKEAEQEAERSS